MPSSAFDQIEDGAARSVKSFLTTEIEFKDDLSCSQWGKRFFIVRRYGTTPFP
jgi:hypothetical protein